MFLSNHLQWCHLWTPPHIITSAYNPSYSKDWIPPCTRSCGNIPTPRLTYVVNRIHNKVLTFLRRKLGPRMSKATSACEEKRLEMPHIDYTMPSTLSMPAMEAFMAWFGGLRASQWWRWRRSFKRETSFCIFDVRFRWKLSSSIVNQQT